MKVTVVLNVTRSDGKPISKEHRENIIESLQSEIPSVSLDAITLNEGKANEEEVELEVAAAEIRKPERAGARSNGQTMAVIVNIPEERIRDLLCCALEGGSNYWYDNLRPVHQDGTPIKRDERERLVADWKKAQPEGVDRDWPWCYIIPFTGNAIELKDVGEEGGKTYRLGLPEFYKGLSVMAALKEGEGGHHFPDFLKGDDDATTGDVFLNCCCFGEIKYG